MLEIFIKDFIKEIDSIAKLCNNNWTKFGNCDGVVLFKDIGLKEGIEELKRLKIDMKIEEWKG